MHRTAAMAHDVFQQSAGQSYGSRNDFSPQRRMFYLLMSVLPQASSARAQERAWSELGRRSMESFISFAAIAKSPEFEAIRASARWLIQWFGSFFGTRGYNSKARLAFLRVAGHVHKSRARWEWPFQMP